MGGSTRLRRTVRMPLVWRIFAINAAVLLVASVVLLLSPVTVSSPVAVHEALIVVIGLCVMLVLTLVLLRHAFAPLERLAEHMSRVDLLRPGARSPADGPDVEVNVLTRAFNEMLERLETERRLSSGRAVAALEDERRRIARELHDHVGQVLTGVLLEVDQTARRLPEPLRPGLEEVRAATRDALQDVRRIAQELRPEALDDLGLPSALNALAAAMSRHAGIPIERSFDPDLPPLTPERELAIYRVAQEGLTNLARHSGASRGELHLRVEDSCVVLTVADDGRGIDERSGQERVGGLRGMRERALAAGAHLSIGSPEGRGTVLRLELPVGG